MPTAVEMTCAESVASDASIHRAKEEILKAIEKHKKKLTGIRPPSKGLKQAYDETIQHFNNFRGIPLWYPYVGSGMGNGALVELADGSVKYDFITGIGVHFGHAHPALISANLDAALQNTVMQGNLQQNTDSLELTKLLLESSGLDHCILTTSGAMANENALKLLFQKKAPATRVLAFEKCFMGRTLALAEITDRPLFREGLPHTLSVDYLPFYDWRDPAKSTEHAVSTLSKLLKRYPKQYACMCFEMIQGEGGYYSGSHEFFMALISLLKEHEVAIFVDEVQTFGRTDKLFAFQHFNLQSEVDIVTIGKLAQVSATLYHSQFKPKPGLISQTFTSSTSAIRSAYAIIHSLLHDGYLGPEGKNLQLRKLFVDQLQNIAERHPDYLEGPYGTGLMIAFTPFKGDREQVIPFLRALFDAGVIAFMAGSEPARVRCLVPAGAVTNEDIHTVCQIIEETIVRLK